MIQPEKVKLKVGLPDKFTGSSKDNYEDFAKKLKTYLCLTDSSFSKLLRWATDRGMPITDEVLLAEFQADCPQERKDYVVYTLQPFLYYTLLSLIDGSAQTIIEQVPEEWT